MNFQLTSSIILLLITVLSACGDSGGGRGCDQGVEEKGVWCGSCNAPPEGTIPPETWQEKYVETLEWDNVLGRFVIVRSLQLVCTANPAYHPFRDPD